MPRALTSTSRTDWETPGWLFELLNAEFTFTLDAAADATNTKCDFYLCEEDDALTQPWAPDTVFLNPPYARGAGRLDAWVRKAWEESHKGATVAVLLPASTDTHWWHNYVLDRAEIRFVDGRLKFSGATGPGWFASVIAIFRPDQTKAFLGQPINARGK